MRPNVFSRTVHGDTQGFRRDQCIVLPILVSAQHYVPAKSVVMLVFDVQLCLPF
jgi:hypothetical protein